MSLTGFTSTTLNRGTALGFATIDLIAKEKKSAAADSTSSVVPLLIEIDFKGNQFFYLNSEKLSAYPDEKEVLLQDGVQYKVVTVQPETVTVEEGGQEFQRKLNVVRLQNIEDKYKRANACLRVTRLLTN